MDKHQMSQAGQRLFRITYLLLEKAGNLLSLQKRLVHETAEGLPNRTEDVLQDTENHDYHDMQVRDEPMTY